MKEAISWGYFEVTQEGGRGKPYHFRLEKRDDSPVGLLTPDELHNELKHEIPKIPSNPQLKDGDFKSLILRKKQSNPHYTQEKIEEVET